MKFWQMLCLAEHLNSGNLCLNKRELHLERTIRQKKWNHLINVKKKKIGGNTNEIIKCRKNIREPKDFWNKYIIRCKGSKINMFPKISKKRHNDNDIIPLPDSNGKLLLLHERKTCESSGQAKISSFPKDCQQLSGLH